MVLCGPDAAPARTAAIVSPAQASTWPPLPLREWQETQVSLQLRMQIVGKTRLAFAPMQNHWWQVALYVTARGLSTSSMPYGARTVDIEFDFIDHLLLFRTGEGQVRAIPLREQPIAEFFHDYLAALHSLGIDVPIWPVPAEMADPVPFPRDQGHSAYERPSVERFFHILQQVDRVLKAFRGRFVGKSSPSHFWWGGFDLACTRFSGRPAPPHPGGIPHLPDFVTREAYSHECISAGWWPGMMPGGVGQEPAFYAYAYPEPPGCSDALVRPSAARYDKAMREWILPHRAVVQASEPDAMVLEFLQSTYDIAAGRGSWPTDLERPTPPPGAQRPELWHST